MKLKEASVTNFGSYKNLSIDFDNNGLTLISGSTGSGKSTLCDIVPWILFGRTSKGGSVDEIRSWDTNEPTSGTLTFYGHTVIRTRKPNDLTIDGRRGKDLADTQKLINEALGMDYELYLAGAYMHEFSQPAQFFATTAKNRRTLTEQLVDLKLAKHLSIVAKDSYKQESGTLNEIEASINKMSAQLETMEEIHQDNAEKIKAWRKGINDDVRNAIKLYRGAQVNHGRKTLLIINDITALEMHLKSISDQPDKCSSCGQPIGDHKNVQEILKSKQVELRYHDKAAEQSLLSLGKQITILRTQVNPFKRDIDAAKISKLRGDIAKMEGFRTIANNSLSNLTQMQDLLPTFRNLLISDTISFLENKANSLISEHFDGELSISLKVEEDDKLEVDITKDGHLCAYTQLSKGQRQILRLCFCVAVMESVQNHHGIHLDTLFFDEALDGLDDTFKTKAFSLLEKLALNHDNIFVVEHNENLKLLFSNRIEVSLVNGSSQICRS